LICESFDMSLGTGMGKLNGRMFRIGHLGNSSELTLLAATAGCEIGLKLVDVPLSEGGAQVAMDYLVGPRAARRYRGRD
jgi:alanine-glyoxylate transaminase / serine-glyoxylate transaminase / serine-pyruvate transaminase